MDFNDAALPVVRLRMRPLLAVHPHASADRWRDAMLDAGLLADIGETNGAEDPREWVKTVQEQLLEIAEMDVRRAGLRGGMAGLQWADAPWWAWLLVMVEPLVAYNLGLLSGETAEAHMLGAMLVYILPAIGALGLIAYGWVRFYSRRVGRMSELEEITHDRMALLRSMQANIERISQRTFVARIGRRLLLSTADLDWLRGQALAARRAGLQDLGQDLDQEADRIEGAIKKVLFVPPRTWSQAGLITDRERWEQLLLCAGIAA